MKKTILQQVKDLLTVRDINMAMYTLKRIYEPEHSSGGYLYVFNHIEKAFVIEVEVLNTSKGKIFEYRIAIA